MLTTLSGDSLVHKTSLLFVYACVLYTLHRLSFLGRESLTWSMVFDVLA